MSEDPGVLRRHLDRERRARQAAETIAEEKTREAFQANESLKRLNEDLERQVAERTAELRAARDEAVAAQKELQRSNAELENFAYSVSHDLREPLRMVHSYLELIRHRANADLPPQVADYLDRAIHTTERMQGMVRGLLEYARVTTHGSPPAPVSADACVKAAVENLELGLEEARVSITRDPLPAVCADSEQLARLFQNLISNAVKYRHPGRRPAIHVAARKRDDGMASFRVSDNGRGLAAEDKERAFQLFQRPGDNTAIDGTGIGLAVCKRMVERHGGSIDVESTPGEGATFCFTLPLAEGDAAEGGSAAG